MPGVEPGHLKGTVGPSGEEAPGVIIDNRTELPDDQVREAIMSQWVETAGLQFGSPTSFQLYATSGGASMMTRTPFRAPLNVIEEIKLARKVAETDDDIVAVIGQAINTAFRDGMQNQHEDEATLHIFNECARLMNLDVQIKELYREYLIAGQVTTLSLFQRQRLAFTPSGTEDKVQAQLSVPRIGVLPSENIRVVTNDIFGQGELAYDVTDVALKQWLDTYFDVGTSPAIKFQMARENPVMAALFTGTTQVPFNDQDMFSAGKMLYTLNPRMVHRTTMPKGASAYPRPGLTSNFALLEAKRLLNIMDYSLLQGGTNYIVVVRQGSDKLPAQQPELDNLVDQVRHASRTGVLVGDHRLTVDIITPNLTELLNAEKRKLIGRKLAMAILRMPEQVTHDAGGDGAKQEMTWVENTVTSDRQDVKRHVERFIYEEIVARNAGTFKKGAPRIWFQRIVLSGAKDFFDQVVKARDRGDIPRKYAVEVLGFDYEAGRAQRKREKAAGDDETMVPGSVPFDSQKNALPGSDGGNGRPPGTPGNGQPGSSPPGVDPAQKQRSPVVRQRRGGEPVRAYWDDALATVVRVGSLTEAVVEMYPGHTVGRITEAEREAATSGELYQQGPMAVVPVNLEYTVGELRVLRLAEGLSVVVGQRSSDGAVVAKALCLREPQYRMSDAVELAMRWGFAVAAEEEALEIEVVNAPPPPPASFMESVAAMMQGMQPDTVAAISQVVQGLMSKQPIIVNIPGEGQVEFAYDEQGRLVGKKPVEP